MCTWTFHFHIYFSFFFSWLQDQLSASHLLFPYLLWLRNIWKLLVCLCVEHASKWVSLWLDLHHAILPKCYKGGTMNFSLHDIMDPGEKRKIIWLWQFGPCVFPFKVRTFSLCIYQVSFVYWLLWFTLYICPPIFVPIAALIYTASTVFI